MPGQKNEMNMQKTKERVANLLRQDIGATQNVNLQNAQADREQLAFTSTKEEVQFIDEVLNLPASAKMEFSDEDLYRLKAIQGRKLSRILLEDEKFGGDSEEMENVKLHVRELEHLIATANWDSNDLEPAYERAIAACQVYCDTKKPSFETGVRRKQMVQATLDRLKEESRQIAAAREILENKTLEQWAEEDITIRNIKDMMVMGKEYLAKHEDPLAEFDVKEATGVHALTFEDFAAVIGTFNRGEVEFKDGKLNIINNSYLKDTSIYKNLLGEIKNVELTVENRMMRERLYELAEKKLASSNPRLLDRLRGVLEIRGTERKAAAISRDDLIWVINHVSLAGSDVRKALKQGDTSKEGQLSEKELTERHMRHRLAMVTYSLFDHGGELGDQLYLENEEYLKEKLSKASDKTEEDRKEKKRQSDNLNNVQQQKEQLRAKVDEILEKGKQLGVKIPSLSKHQMDNLVNGGLLIVRENVFSALNQVYQYATRLKGGKGADFNMLAAQTKLADKIAALALTQYATTSETRKQLTQLDMEETIKEAAFSLVGQSIKQAKEKAQKLKKENKNANVEPSLEELFDKMNIPQLEAGSEGVDYAVARRLPESKEWKRHQNDVKRGTRILKQLCTNMSRFGALRRMALEEGLSQEEARNMVLLGHEIDSQIKADPNVTGTSIDLLALVAKELKDTRFANGYEQAKKLIDQQFSFKQAAIKLAEATMYEKAAVEEPQEEVVITDTKEKLKKLDKDARKVADVMLFEQNPASLIKESEDQNAKSLLHLREVLRTFPRDKVYVKDVSISGMNARLIQKADNSLHFLVGGQVIPLTKEAQQIADLIENDIMENDRLYGIENAMSLLEGLDLGEKALVIKDPGGANPAEKKPIINMGAKIRARNLLVKLVSAETKKPETFYTNVSPEKLKEFAQDLLKGARTPEQVIKAVNEIDTKEYINGQETRELLEHQAKDEELGTVLIHEPPQERAERVVQDWPKEQKQVQILLTELIYSQNTWTMDDKIEKPAERLQEVLKAHLDTLVMLLDKTELIDQMLDQMPFPEVSEEEKGTEMDLRGQLKLYLKSFLEAEPIRKLKSLSDGKTGWVKTGAQYAQKLMIYGMLESDAAKEAMVMLDNAINQAVEGCVGGIQNMIGKMAEEIFGGNDSEEEEEYKDPREEGISLTERLLRMRASKRKLASIMEDELKGATGQGLFIKNVLKNYFSNAQEKMPVMDQRAMLASALLNVKPMPELSDNATDKEKEDAQKTAICNFMGGFLKGAGPLLQKMLQGMPEGAMPEELRDVLKDMKSNLAPIPDRIVRAQLQNMIDRSNKKITRIEVTRALGAASVGQAFLCKLYGPGMPEDGRDVVVKLLRPNVRNRMLREKKVMLYCAKLTDEMSKTKKTEENKKENKEIKDVAEVVKTDAKTEVKKGNQESTDVMGGMEATYRGQLARIEEELDLTIEARNVQKGTVYDDGFTTVQAMKVCNAVEPTANSLVVERAPGTTVDKYMEETRAKQKEILSPFYVRNEKGEIQKEENGRNDKLRLTDANLHHLVQAREQLTEMLAQMQKRQEYLLQLTDLWMREGIYGNGFYHGDLHAGNIMVDDSGLTVIDFGNVTKLNEDQQKYVTRLMMAASVRDVEVFRHCFHKLLENTPEDKYQEKRDALTKVFEEVLRLGDASSVGLRIAAALMKAQSLGIELPPAVHNFSQCQIRLQNTVDDMNARISTVQKEIQRLDRLEHEQNQTSDVYHYLHNDICLEAQRELQRTIANKEDPDETLIADKYRNEREKIYATQDQVRAALCKKTKNDRDSFVQKYLSTPNNIVSSFTELEDFFRNIKKEMNPATYGDMLPYLVGPMKELWNKARTALFTDTEKDLAESIGQELEECLQHFFEEGTAERLQDLREQIKDVGRYREYEAVMQQLKTFRDAQDDPETAPEELEQLEHALSETVTKLANERFLKSIRFERFRVDLRRDNADVRAAMDANMQTWFADTANFGAELKEAYEAYRAAEAAQAEDTEQKLDELMSVYQKAVASRLTQMENLFRSKKVDMGEPDDFLVAMGGVISENVKSSLSRMGYFRSIKYGKIMVKEAEEEQALKKEQQLQGITEEQLQALEFMRAEHKKMLKKEAEKK